MAETLTINLARPIKSVGVIDDYSSSAGASVVASVEPAVNRATSANHAKLTGELEEQKKLYADSCRAVQDMVTKLSQSYDEIFTEHKEEIAKLSVEIARKILMQKVQEGDYEIELLVKEAIKSAPAGQDLVVHLNSQDLEDYQKAQQDSGGEALTGVEFVADENIARAECVVKSPKGIINLLIDEHLEQIESALKKAD